MSGIEKLKKKFYEKPTRNDITMREVIRLANAYGCEIFTGGNHQIRIVSRKTGRVIPIPQHGDNIKEAYIIELKEMFDEIERMEGCDK